MLDYAEVYKRIKSLAIICGCNTNETMEIIELLTGHLWCEEAAGMIKEFAKGEE